MGGLLIRSCIKYDCFLPTFLIIVLFSTSLHSVIEEPQALLHLRDAESGAIHAPTLRPLCGVIEIQPLRGC